MTICQELFIRSGTHFLCYASAAGGILGILYNFNGRILDSAFIMAAVALGAFATVVLIGVIIAEYLGLIRNRKVEAEAAKAVAESKAREQQARDETREYRAQMTSFCNFIISGQVSVRCKDVQRLQTFIRQGNANQEECRLLLQQWYYDYNLNLANQRAPNGPLPQDLFDVIALETLV